MFPRGVDLYETRKNHSDDLALTVSVKQERSLRRSSSEPAISLPEDVISAPERERLRLICDRTTSSKTIRELEQDASVAEALEIAYRHRRNPASAAERPEINRLLDRNAFPGSIQDYYNANAAPFGEGTFACVAEDNSYATIVFRTEKSKSAPSDPKAVRVLYNSVQLAVAQDSNTGVPLAAILDVTHPLYARAEKRLPPSLWPCGVDQAPITVLRKCKGRNPSSKHESLRRLAEMPQDLYDNVCRRYNEVHEAGFAFDLIGNNLVFDDDKKRVRFYDLYLYESDRIEGKEGVADPSISGSIRYRILFDDDGQAFFPYSVHYLLARMMGMSPKYLNDRLEERRQTATEVSPEYDEVDDQIFTKFLKATRKHGLLWAPLAELRACSNVSLGVSYRNQQMVWSYTFERCPTDAILEKSRPREIAGTSILEQMKLVGTQHLLALRAHVHPITDKDIIEAGEKHIERVLTAPYVQRVAACIAMGLTHRDRRRPLSLRRYKNISHLTLPDWLDRQQRILLNPTENHVLDRDVQKRYCVDRKYLACT